jgi:hypothetical protein
LRACTHAHEREQVRRTTSDLEVVVPLLLKLPAADCYSFSSQLLSRAASSGREELVKTMASLAPVLARLESPEGMASLIRSLQDVGVWWP